MRDRAAFHRSPALLLAVVLAGCAAGPDYRAPTVEAGERFGPATASEFPAAPVAPKFWSDLGDPLLVELVETALRSNHDLRLADARLAEARALRGANRFDLAPTVTAGGSYARQRLAVDAAAATAGRRNLASYAAGFDAAWELDLFGRVRRGLEADSAVVGAFTAERRATQVAIAAEVARTYLEYRGLQSRRAVVERNAENQRESLRLTRARLDAGRGTDFDVARAAGQFDGTQAALPALDTALAEARFRLAVLTGASPGALDDRLAATVPLPTLPTVVAVGTPTDWLRNRPDVARAERELAAATARIGVATAALYPQIGFTGSLGFGAASLGDLGASGSDTYALVPGLRCAAFDLGRVRQRIRAAEAGADGALARWEQTVLRALEETDGALVAYRNSLARRDALERAAEAGATAARLARLRYDGGVADFLAVLDAERTQLEAEDRLAASRTEAATRLIGLYKALGAGWDDAAGPFVPTRPTTLRVGTAATQSR